MNARQRKKVEKRKQWGTYRGRFYMFGKAHRITSVPELEGLAKRVRIVLQGEDLMFTTLYRAQAYVRKAGK